MDLNIITRVESHANDLFKRGLPPIPEDEETVYGVKGEKLKKARARSKLRQSRSRYGVESEAGSEGKAKFHYEDLFSCVTRNIGKGYLLGYLGMCSVNTLYLLLKLLRGRKVRPSMSGLQFQARDYGLFIGLLLAIYNGIMFETRKLLMIQQKLDSPFLARYRGAIAGCLSGLSLLWVPQDRRLPIILFSVVRAFELLMRMGVERGTLPTLPNPDVLLMSASSAVMVHSFVFSPSSLDPSYFRFLSHHVQVPMSVAEAIRRMQLGHPLNLADINRYRAKSGVGPLLKATGYDKLDAGEVIHPGTSIGKFSLLFFLRGMLNSFMVYFPVFTIPAVLLHPNALFTAPVGVVSRVLQGVLRSSTFLSLYCTVGICSLPLFRKLGFTYSTLGSQAQYLAAVGGGLSGLSVILEKKSRRIELALYVMGKALEARYNRLRELKYIPRIPNGEVGLFMVCLSIIMHAYVRYPQMIRRAYYSTMEGFFDSDERHVGTYLGIMRKSLRNGEHEFISSDTETSSA